jgi:hypothetical protein
MCGVVYVCIISTACFVLLEIESINESRAVLQCSKCPDKVDMQNLGSRIKSRHEMKYLTTY